MLARTAPEFQRLESERERDQDVMACAEFRAVCAENKKKKIVRARLRAAQVFEN